MDKKRFNKIIDKKIKKQEKKMQKKSFIKALKERKKSEKDKSLKYIKRLKNKKRIDFNKQNKKNNKVNKSIADNILRKRRMRFELLVAFCLLFFLIGKIAYIQFFDGTRLEEMAYIQQTQDRSINPKRGVIYDAVGNILAISSTVETVTVNPVNILKEDKKKVAKALSEIFNLDYEKVLKKVSKRSSIETIITKIDKQKADELRIWLEENNINNGVNIDEDTKRYYPYNNLASQVIGFCGSDNQGLDGIEAVYEDDLKGEKRKNKKNNRCNRKRYRK